MPDRKQPHHTGDEFMHIPDDQGKPLPAEPNRHDIEKDKRKLGQGRDTADEEAVWGNDEEE